MIDVYKVAAATVTVGIIFCLGWLVGHSTVPPIHIHGDGGDDGDDESHKPVKR